MAIAGAYATLAHKAAAPGIGDGAVAIAPAEVRYVRVTVMEVGDENWAARIERQLGRRTQHQRQKRRSALRRVPAARD